MNKETKTKETKPVHPKEQEAKAKALAHYHGLKKAAHEGDSKDSPHKN